MKNSIKNPRAALTFKTISFDAIIDGSEADTIALALVLEMISGGPITALFDLALAEYDETQYTDAIDYVVNYACRRAGSMTISAEIRADLQEIENLGFFGDFIDLSKTRALELARRFAKSELTAQIAVKLANTYEYYNSESFQFCD